MRCQVATGGEKKKKRDQTSGWVYLYRKQRRRDFLRHSPAALVVEEEDEVEFLFGFVLHLLSDAEHVHGGHGDGHPVVLAAHSRHVGVDDLHTAGDRAVKTPAFVNANTLFTHRLARAYGVGDYTCTTYASFGLS